MYTIPTLTPVPNVYSQVNNRNTTVLFYSDFSSIMGKGYLTCIALFCFVIFINITNITCLVQDLFCMDSDSCCKSPVNVNETTVRVQYIISENTTADLSNRWRLDALISWDPVDTNVLVQYEVQWRKTVSFADLQDTFGITFGQGTCRDSLIFQPCQPPIPTDVITNDSSVVFKDISFGFVYFFRVRTLNLSNMTALGVPICLDGDITDYPQFKSPDCYRETNDAEYCSNQNIIISGEVVNFTIAEVIAGLNEDNIPTVTVSLSWQRPVQVNGEVQSYSIRRRELNVETTSSASANVEEGANFTGDTIFEANFTGLRNNSLHEFRIAPQVNLEVGSISSASTSLEGNTRTLNYRVFIATATTTAGPPMPTLQQQTTTPQNPTPPSTITWVVIAVLILVMLVIIFIAILKCRKQGTKDYDEALVFRPTFHKVSFVTGTIESVAPEFRAIEIMDYQHIKEGERLGSGQYGEVFKGEAKLQGKDQWRVVAIKKPKNAIAAEVIEDFKNEIRLMLELGKHPNIVSVLGCCTVDTPYYLITDFMENGDLLHFLRKCCHEENWQLNPIYKVSIVNQLQIARQIADGMNFVSTTRFFHGDLAARNILVGRDLLIKITDFGLTDDLYQKGYTRLQANAKRPYKWYSPESIEHQYCTLKTDVWSFGVLMWEIVTFGHETPYHGMSINEVLHKLKNGYRMTCPQQTPHFIDKLIKSCWELLPEDRPEFSNLVETINFLLEKSTSEDANYVSAGEEEEVKPVTEAKRKTSLFYKLDFDKLEASDISGSKDSACFSGDGSAMSFVSSSTLSVGNKPYPIYNLEEDTDEENSNKREDDDDDGGHDDGCSIGNRSTHSADEEEQVDCSEVNIDIENPNQP